MEADVALLQKVAGWKIEGAVAAGVTQPVTGEVGEVGG
jgi:hypothetical protein